MEFQRDLENSIFEWLVSKDKQVLYNLETYERLTDTLQGLILDPSFVDLLLKKFDELEGITNISTFIRHALFATACVPTHPYFRRLFNEAKLDWRNKAHLRKLAHAISYAALSAIVFLPEISLVVREPLVIAKEDMLLHVQRYISIKREMSGFYVIRILSDWLGVDNMRIDLLFYNGEFILAVPFAYEKIDACYYALANTVDDRLYI